MQGGGSSDADLRFRKPLLYPAELRDRKENFRSWLLRPFGLSGYDVANKA